MRPALAPLPKIADVEVVVRAIPVPMESGSPESAVDASPDVSPQTSSSAALSVTMRRSVQRICHSEEHVVGLCA